MIDNPLLRPDVQAAFARWAEKLLAETGCGTVEVIVEFNAKDRRYLGYRLGGVASRIPLTGEAKSA